MVRKSPSWGCPARHGGTPRMLDGLFMVYFIENPIDQWVRTGGTRGFFFFVFSETSTLHEIPGGRLLEMERPAGEPSLAGSGCESNGHHGPSVGSPSAGAPWI